MGSATAAYCGIDVAFAKQMTLPIAVCIRDHGRLRPLRLRDRALRKPPRGSGNVAALDSEGVEAFASETAEYLDWLEDRFSVEIDCIAIDAPRDYAPENGRRAAELAMGMQGISCFATPSRSEFDRHRQRARAHLNAGGAESRLPNANQWWMLVGFAIFRQLEQQFECIEVFPNAIVQALDSSAPHKSTPTGYARQLELLRTETGILATEVATAAYGSGHDRLDAVLAAWVASLAPSERVAHGDGSMDTIWSPPVRMPESELIT